MLRSTRSIRAKELLKGRCHRSLASANHDCASINGFEKPSSLQSDLTRRPFATQIGRYEMQGGNLHHSLQTNRAMGAFPERFMEASSIAIRLKSTAVETSDVDDHEGAISHELKRSGVRNVAIIAHVDHGKTTLVDQLLKACSPEDDNEERLLDCGDLEIERGITITSKVTRCSYKDLTVNVVDTPGHADFAGEVDRILSLVDGVCLVVDAAEGPMTQTKYVLSRALNLGLKPLVILNKVDREAGWNRIESGETESELLDLFDALGATDDQMEYLTLYASARDGWVTEDPDIASTIVHDGRDSLNEDVGMKTLLDQILDIVPEPKVESYSSAEDDDVARPAESFSDDKFSLAAVTVGYDSYLGRMCTGRINSGSIALGDELTFLKRDGDDSGANQETSTVAGIFVNKGIERTALEPSIAHAGDIITLAGVPDTISVGDTLTKPENPVPRPLQTPPLAPPTLSMEFGANDGPFAGQEGKEVTPSKIRNRLVSETDNNVTLTIHNEKGGEKTTVFARGELQLGILIEQMRREGFEIVISPPKIVTKIADDGKTLLEPFEEVTIDVDAEYSGTIVSALTSDRKGTLIEMSESSDFKTRLRFEAPSRGLLGFHSEIATTTRGSATINHVFLEDRKHVGALGDGLEKGKLISSETGKASTYALNSLSSRGVLFVEPGDAVYPGMIIGENAKQGDLEVNPVRAKAANNMRTQNKDEKVYLAPPKKMTVEELIGYMSPDEVIEVTPESIRLRKAVLDPVERRKNARVKKQQQDALKRKNK